MSCASACFILNCWKQHNSNAACLCITDNVHGRISVINVLYNNAVFGRYNDCVSCENVLVHILGYGGRLAGACFLPINLSDSGPHPLLLSHISALEHPSHPINNEAGPLKRTGRAWRNWGQNDFEGTSWSSIGHGILCRARSFCGTSVRRWKKQDFKRSFRL